MLDINQWSNNAVFYLSKTEAIKKIWVAEGMKYKMLAVSATVVKST
jgi:hypothetical protein